jgi:hypothetical protein
MLKRKPALSASPRRPIGGDWAWRAIKNDARAAGAT